MCDRDGVPRRHLWEIGTERRNGYSWYSDRTAFIYPLYEKWADKYDTANKLNLSLNSPGANERGLINMNRFSKPELSCFDAIVNAGERIQDAIEKAPENPAKPFKILIRNGVYHEKVIIDRPNIVLVGEDRDSVIIQYAETTASQTIKEYKGKPVHMGVIVLQDNANDCIISGITVYNNYGSTVEKTTTHQMAIYGKATRTIVINSNIFADGNDALSLWCQNGGMYYHADLYLRCPGVDFMCPRGRCYATRCKFVGDSRAILWHDGRGDINNKFVVTCSSFDALSPTKLGRYHHDHQFYLVNCRMSKTSSTVTSAMPIATRCSTLAPGDCAYIIMVANAREATADGCATISTRLLAILPSMALLPFGPLMANGIPKHASETCGMF